MLWWGNLGEGPSLGRVETELVVPVETEGAAFADLGQVGWKATSIYLFLLLNSRSFVLVWILCFVWSFNNSRVLACSYIYYDKVVTPSGVQIIFGHCWIQKEEISLCNPSSVHQICARINLDHSFWLKNTEQCCKTYELDPLLNPYEPAWLIRERILDT